MKWHADLALAAEHEQRGEIIKRADAALSALPPHITDSGSPDSTGGRHDYFSQADYSWPNPDTPDGLPFINRDGESYPGAFFGHRRALRSMRSGAAGMTAAYMLTGEPKYAETAVKWLRGFFLDEQTRMNPHLLYGQAILGSCTGRCYGVIDTVHLMDAVVAADILNARGCMPQPIYDGLKDWFASYLSWLCTHPYGIDERRTKNNHAVCWLAQAAAFARFTGDQGVLKMCAEDYKRVILPNQMAHDGSFPLELRRTKPYAYAIFVVDNMATLCRLLSTDQDNLWEFELADGRGMRKALDWLYPYLRDKSAWAHGRDVEHYDEWPVGMSFMLFAAAAYGDARWAELYGALPKYPACDEVRRNTAVRVPYLWL